MDNSEGRGQGRGGVRRGGEGEERESHLPTTPGILNNVYC